MKHRAANLSASCGVLAVLSLTMCAREAEVKPSCAWVVDKDKECPEPTETGDDGVADDETGDESGGDDNDGPLCVAEARGLTKTVHQCAGFVTAAISFNTAVGDCGAILGGKCRETHVFGPGHEPYEMPAVMACCDPHDYDNFNTYLIFCAADLVEQVCRSVPFRLQKMIDDGKFPVGKQQAQALQNWLALNVQACYDTLRSSFANAEPGELVTASWLVNGGKNKGWGGLENFTITLVEGEIFTAEVPQEAAEHIACTDNNYNNTEIFESAPEPTDGITTVATMDGVVAATLTGPMFGGALVTSTGHFQSRETACEPPWCSSIQLTEHPQTGQWTLEEMQLFADGVVTLDAGGLPLFVERVAIRLYEIGAGAIYIDETSGPSYVLAPGAAAFVISGVGGSTYDLRWASNSSALRARATSAGLSLDSFTIEHLDRQGQRWIITIPATTWK